MILRYYCRYIGTEDVDDPMNVTSTYLFARDEDNLLDNYIHYVWFNVMQGGNSVLLLNFDLTLYENHPSSLLRN